MTATLSAAQIMGRSRKHQERPDPNGPLGKMYDDLRAGMAVAGRGTSWRAEALSSFYGMEIRRDPDGFRLVGEWEGAEFVPAERIFTAEQEAAA